LIYRLPSCDEFVQAGHHLPLIWDTYIIDY